jgi:hypothetical protein
MTKRGDYMISHHPMDDEIDIRKVLKKIDFVEENVKHANLNQPLLQLEVAKYKVQKFRRRVSLETKFNLERARKAIRFRRSHNEGKTKAITEPALKALLDRDAELYQLQKKVNRAIVEEEFAKQLFEVFKQRQSAIKIVAEFRKLETAKSLIDAEKEMQVEKHKRAVKMLRENYHKQKEDEDGDEE